MPSPLVRCNDCRFEWFGPSSSHGLSIIGACSRCNGRLDFLETDPAERAGLLTDQTVRALGDVAPARVLGAPVTWTARQGAAPGRPGPETALPR